MASYDTARQTKRSLKRLRRAGEDLALVSMKAVGAYLEDNAVVADAAHSFFAAQDKIETLRFLASSVDAGQKACAFLTFFEKAASDPDAQRALFPLTPVPVCVDGSTILLAASGVLDSVRRASVASSLVDAFETYAETTDALRKTAPFDPCFGTGGSLSTLSLWGGKPDLSDLRVSSVLAKNAPTPQQIHDAAKRVAPLLDKAGRALEPVLEKAEAASLAQRAVFLETVKDALVRDEIMPPSQRTLLARALGSFKAAPVPLGSFFACEELLFGQKPLQALRQAFAPLASRPPAFRQNAARRLRVECSSVS